MAEFGKIPSVNLLLSLYFLTMSLADHYRALGLRTGASFADIKAAYRRLARKYHPDVNPGNQRAKDRFIQVTQAYEVLADLLQPEEIAPAANPDPQSGAPPPEPSPPPETPTDVSQPPNPVRVNPNLSTLEQQLKQDAYQQLQTLLKKQNYPRAIALVEGLAQRIVQDSEVKQWQAIAYARWGRHLITTGQFAKARIYLDKALKTDPLNKSLWAEVHRDFQVLSEHNETT
jgi:tetratricopeptide (TPR) repeat protein